MRAKVLINQMSVYDDLNSSECST